MRTALSSVCFLFIFGLFAVGQGTLGTISGTVKDSTGAVLPAAKIEILNEDTGISRTTTADASGRFTVPALSLGKYRVTASAQGFQSAVRSGIVLTVGSEAVANFELQVGAVSQTVEVTAETPLVEATTSTMGSLVDERSIRQLPLNGRSYDQLSLLEPGVIGLGASGSSSTSFDYGTGARFSVAGARMAANSFMLDGTDINDHANATPGGAAGSNLGVDGIREFKILTNTFNAEYGRSTGGVISAVTRSGTNELHGSVFEFIRNSALDARRWADREVPPFRRNQFGGAAGGPIQKDKTFFFGTYEGLRQGKGAGAPSFVPTVAAKNGDLPGLAHITPSPLIAPFLKLWPDPNGQDFGDGTALYTSSPTVVTNENYVMGRIDHQFSQNLSLFGRYSFDGDNNNTPAALPGVVTIQRSRRQYSTIQLNDIISPKWLNNFLFAYNRTFQKNDDVAVAPFDGPEYSFIPGLGIGTIQFGASSATQAAPRTISNVGTGNGTPRSYAYNLFQLGDSILYVTGRHSVKFGGDYKRIRDNAAENTSLRGVYTFQSWADFLNAKPSALEGVKPGQNAYRGYRQAMFALYVQDDVKVTSRLTANLGLRWEATNDPSEVNGLSSQLLDADINNHNAFLTPTSKLFNVTKKNFEPRVGLAWQANEKGTTVIRSGFGVYNDHVLPGIYALNLAKDPPFYNLLNANNPTFPNAPPNLLTGALPRLILTNNHLKEPTAVRFNFNIQQQMMKDMLLEVAYIGSESSHLWLFEEINPYTPVAFVNGQPIFPTVRTQQVRFYQNFDSSRTLATEGNANYNALQVTLKRRSSAGVQYQMSYTFAKSMDTKSAFSSADATAENNTTENPFNPRQDHGVSYFSAKNNLLFNASYPFPFKFQQKAASLVLGGWTINTIGTFSSGRPFTARVGYNQSSSGDRQTPDRPNLLPGKSNNPVLHQVARWFDSTAFSLPVAGTLGNVGRNTIIGPGIASFDVSLEKNFAITERFQGDLRAEFFNLLNHPNFSLPATNVFVSGSGAYSGSAGRITNTLNDGRQIQFGLKITF